MPSYCITLTRRVKATADQEAKVYLTAENEDEAVSRAMAKGRSVTWQDRHVLDRTVERSVELEKVCKVAD